ncbi:MAG: tyrosine-type recombinase/integrase [Eubacteriales bacterium]|nr:tyrosine-type recombinase/integrase [Eubacteriales bacterium]
MNEIIIHKGAEVQVYTPLTDNLYIRFVSYLDAKPKTIETYTRALRQLFAYFAAAGITQPHRDDVIAYRESLKQAHKPTTVQNYITAARLFFQWTAQEGIYPNIAEHIKGAKLDREHKKDYLNAGQVKAVIKAVDRSTLQGKRDYAALVLMVTGGLRTIEVSRANIGDLRAAGANTVLYIQGKGKDEKADYVKISEPVEKAIRAYLKARKEADQGAPLFASLSNNNKGQRMTTRAISGLVKAHLTEAGYNSDRLTAHSLRHTAVTLSLLAGKSLEEVQEFARHANITTTQIYNHALDRAKNSCSEAVASAIF